MTKKRSVVNHKEFTDRLALISNYYDSHIKKYMLTVVRKYFLKTWSCISATVKPAPKGMPIFEGFRNADTGKILNTVPVVLQMKDGPKLQYVDRSDPMYLMQRNGETVFLDLSLMGEIQTDIQNIAHWMRSAYPQPRDLSMIPYDVALKKAVEWQMQQEKEAEKTRKQQLEDLKTKALDGLVLLATGSITVNGENNTCMLLKLNTREAIEYEGLRLHHCVGDYYYRERVEKSEAEIWSFRYSLMEPAFTCEIEIDQDDAPGVPEWGKRTLLQCRGLQNEPPNEGERCSILKGLHLLGIHTHLFGHWLDTNLANSKWELVVPKL